MLEPIKKTIEVQCSQKMAFEVFLHEMDAWWPVDKFSSSAVGGGGAAKAITVDARLGGKIVEIGHDDTHYQWGEIRSYDPHDAFSMDFHVPHPKFPMGGTTLVEVRFTQLGEGATRVDLTQSNWEALGEMAESVRGGYEKAWGMIFGQSYRAACEK